jgi:hypothetical protein
MDISTNQQAVDSVANLPIGPELGDTKDRHVPGLVGVSCCLVGAIRRIDDCLLSAIFMLLLLVDFLDLSHVTRR